MWRIDSEPKNGMKVVRDFYFYVWFKDVFRRLHQATLWSFPLQIVHTTFQMKWKVLHSYCNEFKIEKNLELGWGSSFCWGLCLVPGILLMQNFLWNVKLLWQNNLKLKLISLFLFFVSCRSSKRYAYENLITREVQFEKPEDDDDDDEDEDVELIPATDKSKGMYVLFSRACPKLSYLSEDFIFRKN